MTTPATGAEDASTQLVCVRRCS